MGNPIQDLQTLIYMYQKNPDMFDGEEVSKLIEMSTAYGIPFEPKSSPGRKATIALTNLLDTATFGLFPDRLKPQSYTTGEKVSGAIGDIAGFFTAPMAVGTLGARGVSKLLPKIGAKAQGLLSKTGATSARLEKLATGAGKTVAGWEKGLGASSNKVAKWFNTQMTKRKLQPSRTLRSLGEYINRFGATKTGGRMGELGTQLGRAFTEGRAGQTLRRATQFGIASGVAGGFDKTLDRFIADSLGGATLGAIGGWIASIPAKNRVLTIRNLARLLYAQSAGTGDYSEQDIFGRLLALSTTVSRYR